MEGQAPSRLTFRPRPPTGSAEREGDRGVDVPLRLDAVRDGILYVPDTAEAAAPVMMFLHGAGGSGRRELRAVLGAADRYGVVIVAPDSRSITWDVIEFGFGPDVHFIDRALDAVVDRCDIDPTRLALGGVSDGATYALSLGLGNGDVFEALVAFSPGGMAPAEIVGRPRVYVSHGTADPVLPIDTSSRALVPLLGDAGYDVTYHEFDGGHTVPAPVADEAFRWWLAPGAQPGPERPAG